MVDERDSPLWEMSPLDKWSGVYKKAKGSKPLSIVPSWLLLYLVPASRFLSIVSTLTHLDDEIQTLTFLVPCPAHAAFGYGLCHRQ